MAQAINVFVKLPFITTILASKFASRDLRLLTVVANAAQAYFLHQANKSPMSFRSVHHVQSWINLFNITTNFWTFGVLVNELGKRLPMFKMNFSWSDLGNIFTIDNLKRWSYPQNPSWPNGAQYRFSGLGYAACIAGVLATIGAVKLLNKLNHLRKHLQIEDLKLGEKAPEITLSWEKPLGQNFIQSIYLGQLVISIALTALSSSRLFFAANAFLSAYSLYKITERKWANISRTKTWQINLQNQYINAVKFTYTSLLMPIPQSRFKGWEYCVPNGDCLQKDPNKGALDRITATDLPDTFVCDNPAHGNHEKCFLRGIILKSDDFVKVDTFNRYVRRDHHHSESIEYTGSLSKTSLPSCNRQSCTHNYAIEPQEGLSVVIIEPMRKVVAQINFTK